MIFVALAARYGITLISEDKKLLTSATRLGVRALSAADYLGSNDF